MIIRKLCKKCKNSYLKIIDVKPSYKWSNRHDLLKLSVRCVTQCLNCKNCSIQRLPYHAYIALKLGYDNFDKDALQVLDYRITKDISHIFSKELGGDLI